MPADYRPDIDGLRAVAIALVVVFHAFPLSLPGGFVGVDAFFVISGYLIAGIIFRELDAGRFSFATFYARRVLRLFPALILVLGACIVFGWLTLLPDEYQQLGRHTAGGVGFVQNAILWSEAGYFDVVANAKPLRHLWSLGVEEQFYLVFPLLAWLAWRTRSVLAVVAALAALSFAIGLWRTTRSPVEAFFLPHARLWELLAGVMLAWVSLHRPGVAPVRVPPSLLSAAGLALIAVAAAVLDEKSRFPGWWALLPVAGSVLIIAAGPHGVINRYILGNPVCVFVGLISYPLYLWHWPLLSWTHIVESGTPSAEIRAWAVGISVALAASTFLLVERPLRRYGTLAVKSWALASTAAVLACIGYSIHVGDGLPSRTAQWKNVVPASTFTWDGRFDNALCRQRYPDFPGDFCLMAKPEPPTVLLLGDSHAMHLHAGLAAALRTTPDNLATLADVGCLPIVDARLFSSGAPISNLCRPRMNALLERAIQMDSVHTILMAAYGGDTKLAEADYAAVADGMRRTLTRFLHAGKRLVWIIDIPQLYFDPRECAQIRPLSFSPRRNICGIARSYHEELRRPYHTFIRSVLAEFPNITIVDAATPLCDETICWAMRDGKSLYVDPNHLTIDGSAIVGRYVTEALPVSGRTADGIATR